MFIVLNDPTFDKRLDALCAVQRPPSNRNALGVAIIKGAVAAFEASEDALCWQIPIVPKDESETPAA